MYMRMDKGSGIATLICFRIAGLLFAIAFGSGGFKQIGEFTFEIA